MSKNIALIATSANSWTTKGGDKVPSGCWYEELAAPYLKFLEAGHNVKVYTPDGQAIPFDAGSMSGDFFTAECEKFKKEHEETLAPAAIDAIDVAETDAIYFAGGHACYTDMQNKNVSDKINEFTSSGKIVALDCHGPAAICTDAVKNQAGAPLVSGLDVCCFTDTEEAAVGALDNIPYSCEQRMKELGGNFKGGADWGSNVCVAPVGTAVLITGQNPASSNACAQAVIDTLKSRV